MSSRLSVSVGGIRMGGGTPVSIQSMLTEPLNNVTAALKQTENLHKAGCEIIRVAVPSNAVLPTLKIFASESPMPVVADIHFDGRLAIKAIEAGCHKIRINPGNLQNPETLTELAALAKERSVPIRVGVNSGSVAPRKGIRPEKIDPVTLLIDTVARGIQMLTDLNFNDIVVSAKFHDVFSTIATYRRLAGMFPYPLHLGVTAAGGLRQAVIKHALAFGVLLAEGIGDTLRVSITGDPIEEVRAGWDILRALNLRKRGAVVVSCPTCGRTAVPLDKITAEVETTLEALVTDVGEDKWPDSIRTVAVMGCVVNGPGEAAAADIGAAFEKTTAVIFRKGEIIERVPVDDAVQRLVALVEEAIDASR